MEYVLQDGRILFIWPKVRATSLLKKETEAKRGSAAAAPLIFVGNQRIAGKMYFSTVTIWYSYIPSFKCVKCFQRVEELERIMR